ncbi:MAG: LarC family nickel insertion protein, partial [Fibromonadales bacterium]|nr:LarC family nickel insertion protein [Fibromonadales bacterium]
MKTLYFECNMGAAGDMLMAALLELHDNPKDFLERLNNVGIPDVKIMAEPSNKCGISGTHIKVRICKGDPSGRPDAHHHDSAHHHTDHHHVIHHLNLP